ncbi:MAG: TonB-dependent receptor domain-containing protein [Luteolibacter sp.]
MKAKALKTIAFSLLLSSLQASAQAPPADGGKIIAVENQVDRSPPKTVWTRATPGDPLKWQDQVRTGELSRAAVELGTGGVLRISEFTSLRLQPPPTGQPQGRSKIDIAKGVAYFFSRTEAEADIETPSASLNIRGTEFVIEVGENGSTTVTMVDGAVNLANSLGTVDLASGEQGIAEPGKAPRKTAVIDASEKIQWFLYYPGIVDPASFPHLKAGRFGKSLAAYSQGDLLQALALLPAARTAEEYRFSAAVKLATGRVDQVEADLRKAGNHPLVDSLRLLIDVIGKPAAEMGKIEAPPGAEGEIVLSYALQSSGNLQAALDAAKRAVEKSPNFGLAWARIAELEFSFGRTEAAIQAVDRSLEFSPRNAQAISLRGYLEMSKNRIAGAQEYFSQAIAIDPALGNAWLGRGLAYFQSRNREEGLRAVTMAAAVEPNRSFLRSYLGKALAENRKDERAANELGIARRLDPGDPTAPFYQSLLDQRGYAYNEGIANLEESVRLNDNRAIFRSGFLLDKDRSVRQANLASLYKNVGMTEASLEEARRAVVSDYLNPSAHLFLSNSVNALRDTRRVQLRYETPWFNELLIANLLSPAGTDLLPQNVSQQEYTSLFPTDRLNFSSRTLARSDGEILATGSFTGRADKTSVAVDYDIFSSDGQFPNEDVERYTAYFQLKHALTPRDSVYLNLKFEELERGDSRTLYDPSTLDPDVRVEQKQAPVTILGYQHEWSPGSRTLLLGGALTDEIESVNPSGNTIVMLVDPTLPELSEPLGFESDVTQLRETEVYFGEIQQIWSDERQTFIVGTRYDSGSFPTTNTFSNQVLQGVLPADPYTLNADPRYERWTAYAYYTRELARGLWATAGLTYDHQKYPLNSSIPPATDDEEKSTEFLPKAGLVWTPNPDLTFRLGYARSVGGATFDESVRLEPTQVAGFIQSFRTLVDGSEVGGLPSPYFETGGVSVLYKLPTRTYLGAEAFVRTAESERGVGVIPVDPFTLTTGEPFLLDETVDYEEWGGSFYVNQLLSDEWAVGARYTYIDAELDRAFPELAAANIVDLTSSEHSDLHQAEAYLIWNHAEGWFSRLSARFFSQDNAGYNGVRPDDSWAQFDVSVGKRFWNNRGAIEIGILNINDEDYRHNPLITLPLAPRERMGFIELRMEL